MTDMTEKQVTAFHINFTPILTCSLMITWKHLSLKQDVSEANKQMPSSFKKETSVPLLPFALCHFNAGQVL